MVADGWAHRGISAPSVFESHSFAAALEISRMTFLVSGSESDTESPAVARLASQEASLAAPEKGVSTKSVAPSTPKARRGVNTNMSSFSVSREPNHQPASSKVNIGHTYK